MFRNIFTKPLFPLGLLLFVLASCEFKPDGEYFRDLNPNVTPPDLSVEIVGHSDTIFMLQNESLTAIVHTTSPSLLAMELFIDDSSCQLYPSNGGKEFVFFPTTCCHSDGVYRIRLDFYTGSGTGSIADHLGAEVFLFSKEFYLILATHIDDIDLTLMYEDFQGSLKLSLQPYKYINNPRTIITKSIGYGQSWDTVAILEGASNLSAMDNTYVGENSNYRVNVYLTDAQGEKSFLYATAMTTKYEDLPSPDISLDATGRPHLSWPGNRYKANCAGYKIFTREENATGATLIGTINDLNDTTFQVGNPTFPGYHEYRVAPFPKTLPSYYTDNNAWEYFGMRGFGYTGLPSFYFTRMYVPNGPYFYYDGASDIIERVSAISLTIEKEIHAPVTGGYFLTYKISPNDVYLLGICSASSYSVYFTDVATMASVTFPAADIFGNGVMPGVLSVSDNGIGAMTAGTKLYAYDFMSHTLIGSADLPTETDMVAISPGGDYILVKNDIARLFKVEATGISQVWSSTSTSGNFTWFSFLPGSSDKALMFADHVLTTFQCPQMSVVKTIPVTGDEISNIDFTTGRVLSSNSSEFFINDLNSGAQTASNASKPYSVYNLRISKDAVYHSSGKKLIMY